MELRKLTSDYERQVFGECLTKARATRGVGFRETQRSLLGGSHLRFGSVYAIFENERDPLQRMLGGFIMHSLATLPQSFAKPDLSHLPPQSILEGSDLWSLSKGAGHVAARAAAAVAGFLQAKAIIVYPIVRPVDLTSFYARFSFATACEPIRNPFGETLDGGEIWVQPLTLEGDKLEAYIRWGFELLFQANGGAQVLRFDASLATRPPNLEVSRAPREEDPKRSLIPTTGHPQEPNGTTPEE